MKSGKKFWSIAGCVFGTFLMLGPIWGALYTSINLQRTFSSVSSPNIDASQKAQVLSRGIEVSQSATLAGLLAVPIGLCLTVFSIWRLVRREDRADAEPN